MPSTWGGQDFAARSKRTSDVIIATIPNARSIASADRGPRYSRYANALTAVTAIMITISRASDTFFDSGA